MGTYSLSLVAVLIGLWQYRDTKRQKHIRKETLQNLAFVDENMRDTVEFIRELLAKKHWMLLG